MVQNASAVRQVAVALRRAEEIADAIPVQKKKIKIKIKYKKSPCACGRQVYGLFLVNAVK